MTALFSSNHLEYYRNSTQCSTLMAAVKKDICAKAPSLSVNPRKCGRVSSTSYAKILNP